MALPQMNPLAAKLMGGIDYRKKLRQQLLDAAERADDPAYRQRLLEVADGKRPLRTLLHDPAFLKEKSIGTDSALDEELDSMELPKGTPAEVQARMKDRLDEMGIPIPGMEEAQAVFPEVLELQRQADAVVAEERSRHWGLPKDGHAGA